MSESLSIEELIALSEGSVVIDAEGREWVKVGSGRWGKSNFGADWSSEVLHYFDGPLTLKPEVVEEVLTRRDLIARAIDPTAFAHWHSNARSFYNQVQKDRQRFAYDAADRVLAIPVVDNAEVVCESCEHSPYTLAPDYCTNIRFHRGANK